MSAAGPVAGVDVGGTTIKVLVVAPGGEVLAEERAATPQDDPTGRRVADAVARLVAHRDVTAAGVVVPGIVDEDRGVAVWSANLGFRDAPMLDLLRERLGVPVTLGQDVRAGALAESVRGAAADEPGPVAFVPVGTGVAAAVVVDGRPVVSGGWAGEIGRLVLDGGRRAGRVLEEVGSATALARRSGETGAREVVARVRAGDPAVLEAWEDAVEALAVGLSALVVSVAPTVVVVGGGLGQAGPVLLDPLAEALAARTAGLRQPRLVVARFGDLAAAHGGALLASGLLAEGTAA